ncbi:MAG: PAS domain S-box protein [Bacteroidota bacterium]
METKWNKLLLRQVKKHFGSVNNLPDEVKGIFLDINNTYFNFEDDTQLLQNSIEISSQELREAYQKQKQDAESQKATINKIKEAIYALNPSDQHNINNRDTRPNDSSYLFESLIKLIEERNKAEEEILKLSKAVEQNPASIVITDINGDIEYVNPKFCDLTGYKKEEALGKNPRILKSENTTDEHVKDLWSTILSGKEWSGELQNKKKNGELYWESALISPIINDNRKITHFIAIKEDITERKRAEAERIRQSGLITSLLDSIPDIIFFKDTEGFYLGCNLPFAEFVGKAKNEIVGKTDHDLFDNETADLFTHFDKEMLKLKVSRHNEEWITYPDGRKVLLDTLKTPYWASNGSLIGILGISRDITMRKEAEDALQLSSKKWEAIIAASPDGIGMASLDGKLQLMSDKLATMYGYSFDQKEEYFGKTIFDFIDPSHHEKLVANIRKLIAGEHDQQISEYLALKKDHSKFYVDVNSTLLCNSQGDPESILFVERDITSRKQSEEVLQNERTLFRTIIDLIPDAVYVKDTEGRKIIANPKEVLFAGKNSESEVIGKTDFQLHPDIEAKRALEEDKLVLHTGKPLYDIDGTLTDRDGNFHWLLCSKVPLHDVHGKITGLVGVTHDITEQKKTEAILLKSKQEADIASKAKSEFLANMSHEIRTPLNGVIGFTDLLLKTPLTKIQKQYAENVNISGHSLLGIISDILDFSKIEAGKMELDHIQTDIIELAEQTSDIIKYHASQKGLELLLNIQSDVPRFILADPIRLKQILVNLLGNAVKFTATGEVELKIMFTKTDETLGKFRFSVRDTGIGITQEQQNKLFKAFTQADSSTTRKFGGTGLGLTISNMLAEKMGSNIEIISKIGQGSEFFFIIETDYAVGEKDDSDNLTDVHRVLVIDDNDNNRLILEHTFLNWGLEFAGIDNGMAALKLIEISEPFDVIIVDYHMPEINGIDTIRLIREQLNLSPEKQPTILLHSSADDVDVYDECKRLGVRFNLTKPVKSHELWNYLKSIHSQPVVQTKEIEKPELPVVKDTTNYQSQVILVAEDVTLNMLLVTTVIKQLLPNATVLEAKNGKEALDMAILKKPDLIFMDVQMPEMSGLEATEAIRNHEKGTATRISIVALTAGAIKGEREKCFDAGMDDFLTKPINREALRKMLETHLI